MTDRYEIECPSCGCLKMAFLIVDGKCDSCRTDEIRAATPPYELTLNDVRDERLRLFAETDWMFLMDAPVTEERRATVAAYRDAIRNVPENFPVPTEAMAELRRLRDLHASDISG